MVTTHDRSRPTSRLLLVGGLLGVTVAAYRFALFNGLPNDHYMHLAWAQQVIRGAWPGRDFVEPGLPLTLALSAVAQLAGGRGLLPEVLLCIAMIAAAAVATFWLAIRLTGSIALGMVAVGLQAAIYPRLYNYPKLIVPVVAVALLWRYLAQPTSARAASIGIWIAIGFLFRHDYLLYLALSAGTAFLVLLPAHGRRTTAAHTAMAAATALLVVAPYLAFLQSSGGLGAHVRDTLEFARGEGYQWFATTPRVTIAEAAPAPDRTVLEPAGPLVSLARVVVFDVAPPLSPVVNDANADVVLFYGAFLLPVAIVLGTAAAALRRRPRTLTPTERQVVVLGVLAFAVTLGVIRHPIEYRLADAAGLMPLVLVAGAAGVARSGALGRVSAAFVLVVATVAVLFHGDVWHRLEDADMLKGRERIAMRFRNVWIKLQTPPWTDYWPAGEMPKAVQYLRACTEEGDRVFVNWFAPEVFVFADRGFGGGHSYFTRRAFYDVDHQQQMVSWLRDQRTPVALINLDQEWFRTRFEIVQYYLDEEYTIVGTEQFRDASVAVAMKRTSRPTGVYEQTGWPCFR